MRHLLLRVFCSFWLKWLLQLQFGVLQSHFQLQLQLQFNFGDVAACTCQLTSAR
jgi:hypothetical protein